jgi:translation initiation factor 1
MSDQNSRLVYSTGSAVPRKEKPADRNLPAVTGATKSGTIVRLDRKRRGGKSVTVIEGLRMSVTESEKLLKQLKARLGTGGTVKDGALEIQGDHCDTVITELTKMGWGPKRSGG